MVHLLCQVYSVPSSFNFISEALLFSLLFIVSRVSQLFTLPFPFLLQLLNVALHETGTRNLTACLYLQLRQILCIFMTIVARREIRFTYGPQICRAIDFNLF